VGAASEILEFCFGKFLLQRLDISAGKNMAGIFQALFDDERGGGWLLWIESVEFCVMKKEHGCYSSLRAKRSNLEEDICISKGIWRP